MQDIDFEAGVWAVVTVPGGRQLIGSIPDWSEEEILEKMMECRPIYIEQAFLLVANQLPVQHPKTGQMGYQRLVRCAPVNNCLSPAKLTSTIETIHFFSDMQEADVIEHKSLVQQLEAMLIEARLAKVGITKPTMKGPSGPIIAP